MKNRRATDTVGDRVQLCVYATFGPADQPAPPPIFNRRLEAVRCALRYVAEGSLSVFTDEFVTKAAATSVGNGFDDGTEMGLLANDRRLDGMAALVEDAVQQGAKLLTGGHRIGTNGYFFEHTVLVNVPDTARVMSEEPFGPIAVLNPITSLDVGFEKANNSPFALAAYGFTNSPANVDQMMQELEAGQLSINTFDTSIPEV